MTRVNLFVVDPWWDQQIPQMPISSCINTYPNRLLGDPSEVNSNWNSNALPERKENDGLDDQELCEGLVVFEIFSEDLVEHNEVVEGKREWNIVYIWQVSYYGGLAIGRKVRTNNEQP